MAYHFIRGYSFREPPNPAILIDGRQLQVSAASPSTGETEHEIPSYTCRQVSNTRTQQATQMN